MVRDFRHKHARYKTHLWKTLRNAGDRLAQLQTGEQRPDALQGIVSL